MKWLLCAQVTLSTEQMIDLVSPVSKLFFSDMITIADNLGLCCNLVVLDMELDCFRFAHVSIRDFLESRSGFHNSAVHTVIMGKCLDIYDIEPLDEHPAQWRSFQSWPSFQYATKYWMFTTSM